MEGHQAKEVATKKISTDDSPPYTSAAEKAFPGVPATSVGCGFAQEGAHAGHAPAGAAAQL